ncbi:MULTISPECIES: ANTAR domain-containing protein [Streptomyces]|uniref:ANTAR domain-containing protein n=1 Tax=Streptomyces violaceoruber TaxID=1935 RepID=A0ACD4WLJ5_STRVN|nr:MULTISPECIES: ANTAR domain-containing protein [Streptomyces]BDD76724.1 ANTAR domain-containing protein [Streptomyces coelicolor]MDX3315804.1 ANTAR domain-containing protein [Streptomyces sp. ME03-5684b]MDX3370795.1 ANTAR domain-containing protein [Streptomyces sp. ME02-6987-2C]MDX3399376.1 ANTAR domain-containing protein [Streptomyces sp. ME01-18h]MDX3421792.1 ANTAR domain-containing protein [Streptomyces sp. ME02-6985-2c]
MTVPPTDVRPDPGPDSDPDQIFRLQEQVRQLKEAVVSHAVVDQAIGVVIALGGVTPDEGWIVLKEVSQHTNIKLRNVAEAILIWGRTGVIPPDILTALEDRLGRPGLSGPPPGSPHVSGRSSR